MNHSMNECVCLLRASFLLVAHHHYASTYGPLWRWPDWYRPSSCVPLKWPLSSSRCPFLMLPKQPDPFSHSFSNVREVLCFVQRERRWPSSSLVQIWASRKPNLCPDVTQSPTWKEAPQSSAYTVIFYL